MAELPGRFIVSSIYSFLVWFILLIFLLLPFGMWSVMLVLGVIAIFVHVMIVFSAFGRLIMHTGCMGKDRIFDEHFEKGLLPRTLQHALYIKAKAELGNKTSITRQYRRKLTPLTRDMDFDDMSALLSQMGSTPYLPPEQRRRGRTNSNVRFADSLWESIDESDSELSTSKMEISTSSQNARILQRPPTLDKLKTISSTSLQSNSSAASAASIEEWVQAANPKQPSTNMKSLIHSGPLYSFSEDVDEENPLSFTSRGLSNRPPRSISTFREQSITSSVGGEEVVNGRYEIDTILSTDEKFDLEFGELMKPDGLYETTQSESMDSLDYKEPGDENRPLIQGSHVERNASNYGSSRTTAGN